MNETTRALLDRLDGIEWFAHVGHPIDDANVDVVHSWKQAIQECRARHYENVELEAQNLLTEALCFKYPHRYHGKWNPLIDDIKARLLPMISEKTFVVAEENQLPDAFEHEVQWCVLGACMESDYSDIVAPRFFTDWIQWYLKGHFPCGWRGDFPDGGHLVVF